MIDLTTRCAECGDQLGCEISYDRWCVIIRITPCQRCLDASYAEGLEHGREDRDAST